MQNDCPRDYCVGKKEFKEDCKKLASTINNNPIEDFLPTHLIALNDWGFKIALELRRNLEIKNLEITQIILDPITYKIKTPLEDIKIKQGILISAIQNSGKLLRKALKYLEAYFEEDPEEIYVAIAILYDRLNISSKTYNYPSYFGVGFPRHNYIKLLEWN